MMLTLLTNRFRSMDPAPVAAAEAAPRISRSELAQLFANELYGTPRFVQAA
jgi:hypothetical protein